MRRGAFDLRSTEVRPPPRKPLSTSRESLLTTRKSLLTTRKSLSTTRKSLSTTRKSLLTTRKSLLTTRKSLSTDDAARGIASTTRFIVKMQPLDSNGSVLDGTP